MRPTSQFFGRPFLPVSALVLWADRITNEGAGEGWVASSEGCTGKRMFAQSVDFWFPVRGERIIYSDVVRGNNATLRYIKFGPGGQWDPGAAPTTIRANITRIISPVGPEMQYVLFNVAAGGAEDGLYMYGPIGFGAR